MDALTVAMAAVDADLASAPFQRGVASKRWKVVKFDFPVLLIEIAATTSDGEAMMMGFRFTLDGYPNSAPDVRCWDMTSNAQLHADKRPGLPLRTREAFKEWGYGVYRPWERNGGSHNNWATTHPHLAWHPRRNLTFILEDLYELLNAFPRKSAVLARTMDEAEAAL